MNLTYNGNNQKIIQSVSIANRIMADPVFYAQIATFPDFAYSVYTGERVAEEMRSNLVVKIQTYWNPLSGATAKTQTEININSAKLSRPIPSIVNTIIHESVHFIDWATNRQWDYTDRNAFENPPISAPYKIGNLAEGFASSLL